jgi:hypothetical protein
MSYQKFRYVLFLNPTSEFRQAELDIKIGGSRVDIYEKVG